MRRPIGITVLALILGWLSIGGFGNAWVILGTDEPYLPSVLGVLALVYGVVAMALVIGLWRMQPWSIVALRGWMLVCLGTMATFAYTFGVGAVPLIWWVAVLVFFLFVVALFWWLDRYVQRVITAAA